jgi:E3 ubiquitin-protein ligase CHFR
MIDVEDMITNDKVYVKLDNCTVEVEIMLDYIGAEDITPRRIYKEVRRNPAVSSFSLNLLHQIVSHVESSDEGYKYYFDDELFMDRYGISSHSDSSPRKKICRECATDVFIWGLKDWRDALLFEQYIEG